MSTPQHNSNNTTTTFNNTSNNDIFAGVSVNTSKNKFNILSGQAFRAISGKRGLSDIDTDYKQGWDFEMGRPTVGTSSMPTDAGPSKVPLSATPTTGQEYAGPTELSQDTIDQVSQGSKDLAKLYETKPSFLLKTGKALTNPYVNMGFDVAGNIADAFGGTNYNGPKGDLRAGIDQGWNNIADSVSALGPYGQIASGAMKAVGALNKISGAIFGATDNMTTTDAIMDSPLGMLTGVGWVNQAFGKTSDTITRDDEAFAQVGSSYGSTMSNVNDALEKSGKKYGAFSGSSRKKANDQIREARFQQNAMSNIADTASLRTALKGTQTAMNNNRAAFNMQGGYRQSNVHAAKYGMSFKDVSRAKRIISGLKFKKPKEEPIETPIIEEPIIEKPIESNIEEFEKGGKVNVIPEGALHAHKHHMENAKDLTKKGIPVVSETEDGKLLQHAEIERNEIIYRLEVTEKLELLQKIYEDSESSAKDKENAALEAGKLLVEETLYNTDDRTNLLNNEKTNT